MYQAHPSFEFPGKRAKLWRYMDFTKFVSMLDSGSLYFCRADQLGDSYEASVPEGMLRRFEQVIAEAEKEETDEAQKQIDLALHSTKFLKGSAALMAKTCYVNCWHSNQHESHGMWKTYLKASEGVSLRSSPARLVKALAACQDDVFIGKARYVDYRKAVLHDRDGAINTFNFVIHKRITYRHEQEVRAVIWKVAQEPPVGIMIPVDLNVLVHSVFVAPDAPPWFETLVASVSRRYGYSFKIVRSHLASPPVS